MHLSWMMFGDRFVDGPHFELINSARAYVYAHDACIEWLEKCNVCPAVDLVVPGAPYTTPANDPAPWYRTNNPDTEDFLGVIGLDVVGAEGSTRTASVMQAVSGGGVVGPLYKQARTMVVRILAIARSEIGLQAGLDWLDNEYDITTDPCLGDSLTFFDACPCMCDNVDPLGYCWVHTYRELIDGPEPDVCEPDWWPKTYAELKKGPPITSETWCSWIVIYRHLKHDNGPPDWACCVDQCVVPYMRQFNQCRIVQGPIVTERPNLHSDGACAVIELTIVAADPHEYTVMQRATQVLSHGNGQPQATPFEAMALSAAAPDPFTPRRAGRSTLLAELPVATDDTVWVRDESIAVTVTPNDLSDRIAYIIRLASEADTQAVRVGLWSGEYFITGYQMASVPPGYEIFIDAQRHRLYAKAADGTETPLSAFIYSWDGVTPVSWVDVYSGPITLSVDRVEGDTTVLGAELLTASQGAS